MKHRRKGTEKKSKIGINTCRTVYTVILEIFAFANNLRLKETTKMKYSKLLFKLIFTTVNIYGLLKPQIIDYSEN